MELTLERGLDFVGAVGRVCQTPKAKPALEKWSEDAKKELGAMMVAQVSPDGTPYRPLSPVTIALKGHDRALYETGAMEASLIGSGDGHIEDVTNDSVTLGTAHEKRGRPVAAIHQFGEGRIPARPFVGVNEDMVDDAAELVAGEIIQQISRL